MNSEPKVYAIVNMDNVITSNLVSDLDIARFWIKQGHTVSEFSISKMVNSVKELEK